MIAMSDGPTHESWCDGVDGSGQCGMSGCMPPDEYSLALAVVAEAEKQLRMTWWQRQWWKINHGRWNG